MNALAGFKLQGKKNSLTREQAMGIYDDLKKNFTQYENAAQKKARLNVAAKQKAYTSVETRGDRVAAADSLNFNSNQSFSNMGTSTLVNSSNPGATGMWSAFAFVTIFTLAKIALSALEYSGLASVDMASALMQTKPMAVAALPVPAQQFSPEKIQLLTSLDNRRAEIESRGEKLSAREEDIKKQEQDLVARTQELRELTATLRADREKNDKRKDGQLEQLANVYGAMDPVEAAKLIQQLDVTIALGLLKRMPEKRIGQILSLMQPERALTITKMLSGSPA